MSTRDENNCAKWGPFERQRMWLDGVVGGTWFVFVHGGAWRDASKTHLDGVHLCESIRKRFPAKFNGFASVDYRLSSEVKDPAQVQDVACAINVIRWEYRPDNIVVAGHSCGAFLAAQAYEEVSNTNAPITHIYGIEGIYYLDRMVDEYPSYESFVAEEFSDDREAWRKATPDWAKLPKLMLLHSKEDELLSLKIPQEVQRATQCELIELPHGKHFEVVEELDISEHFA